MALSNTYFVMEESTSGWWWPLRNEQTKRFISGHGERDGSPSGVGGDPQAQGRHFAAGGPAGCRPPLQPIRCLPLPSTCQQQSVLGPQFDHSAASYLYPRNAGVSEAAAVRTDRRTQMFLWDLSSVPRMGVGAVGLCCCFVREVKIACLGLEGPHCSWGLSSELPYFQGRSLVQVLLSPGGRRCLDNRMEMQKCIKKTLTVPFLRQLLRGSWEGKTTYFQFQSQAQNELTFVQIWTASSELVLLVPFVF